MIKGAILNLIRHPDPKLDDVVALLIDITAFHLVVDEFPFVVFALKSSIPCIVEEHVMLKVLKFKTNLEIF